MVDKRKNIDLWEGVLENMPKDYKKWFEEENQYLHNILTKDSKVLEVGCGEGRSINDILDITHDVVGIDHEEKAVSDAKKNFEKIKNVKILKANAEDLPFENAIFDFVICMTTFANFADRKYVILKEMKRVLKNDGKIVISVFSEEAMGPRMKIYNKLKAPIKEVKENGTVVFEESLGDNISEQFSKKELIEIFKKAKLKITDIKKVNMAYLCTLAK